MNLFYYFMTQIIVNTLSNEQDRYLSYLPLAHIMERAAQVYLIFIIFKKLNNVFCYLLFLYLNRQPCLELVAKSVFSKMT